MSIQVMTSVHVILKVMPVIALSAAYLGGRSLLSVLTIYA